MEEESKDIVELSRDVVDISSICNEMATIAFGNKRPNIIDYLKKGDYVPDVIKELGMAVIAKMFFTLDTLLFNLPFSTTKNPTKANSIEDVRETLTTTCAKYDSLTFDSSWMNKILNNFFDDKIRFTPKELEENDPNSYNSYNSYKFLNEFFDSYNQNNNTVTFFNTKFTIPNLVREDGLHVLRNKVEDFFTNFISNPQDTKKLYIQNMKNVNLDNIELALSPAELNQFLNCHYDYLVKMSYLINSIFPVTTIILPAMLLIKVSPLNSKIADFLMPPVILSEMIFEGQQYVAQQYTRPLSNILENFPMDVVGIVEEYAPAVGIHRPDYYHTEVKLFNEIALFTFGVVTLLGGTAQILCYEAHGEWL